MYQAVETCYREQIGFIWSRLSDGMSVLVRCEKHTIPYLQRILKKKLATDGKAVEIVDGRNPDDGGDAGMAQNLSRIGNIVAHLRRLVHHTDADTVFLLPYLDIITSVSHGGLSMEGKEIMTMIHENPFLTLAVFEDPEFPLPELIAQALPARAELLGIPRQRLSTLITASEARSFGDDELNLTRLFKYVSGLSPVQLRQILNVFARKADYNPADPGMLDAYYRELRTYTSTGGADLSSVKLDDDIAGYADVKSKIHDNILGLMQKTLDLEDETQVRQVESIIPRGLIFYGPPGTGKTLFSKGIAEALNATIYIVSGPELKSKWVGQGEANVRRHFARARATAPSVIVFDEIDSMASRRSAETGDGGTEAAHSMVNQLLTEIDGFRKEELVFVIATTNFVESLDPAFLRPGRFEYTIEIPYPEWEDRQAILMLYNRKLTLGLTDEDIDMLAGWTGRATESGTPHTGDHLNALMRELKRYLLQRDLECLSGDHLVQWLRSRVKTQTLSRDEERVVAIHETGHALMLHKYGRADDIRRITIDSGVSDALGLVETQQRENINLYTEESLRQEIGIGLGGYAAEKLMLGQCSTGASQDLFRATRIAEDMVALFGMGDLEVPRSYSDSNGRVNPFYNMIVSPQIDAILVSILGEVTAYLTEYKALLETLTTDLLEHRTLTPGQIRAFFGAPA